MSLDKALFNTITVIAKGSYLSLCIDLTGENARYTSAIIAMYKHAALTVSNRRMVAMTQLADLKYHGTHANGNSTLSLNAARSTQVELQWSTS